MINLIIPLAFLALVAIAFYKSNCEAYRAGRASMKSAPEILPGNLHLQDFKPRRSERA